MAHLSRRRTLGLAGASVAAVAGRAAAQSDAFPSRPIKIVVPQAAGGNADAFGRILAQGLGERIGQQVIVENKGGAGGTVGSAMVAKSPPDGYTLVVGDNGTHGIAPTLYGAKLQYDVFKDFTPIMLAVRFPSIIVMHPSVPAHTIQEFVALVKSQPGKITYSSAGTGNASQLTITMFQAAAGGLDMVHVPYRGGAPAMQALVAGEVQLCATSINTALPHIQAGKIRPLGIAAAKRIPILPDVPTFYEAGIPFQGDSWLGLLGPAGIPDDIVAKLNREIAAALRQPGTSERLVKIGQEVVASSPAELADLLQRDVAKWGKAVKDSGAVAD